MNERRNACPSHRRSGLAELGAPRPSAAATARGRRRVLALRACSGPAATNTTGGRRRSAGEAAERARKKRERKKTERVLAPLRAGRAACRASRKRTRKRAFLAEDSALGGKRPNSSRSLSALSSEWRCGCVGRSVTGAAELSSRLDPGGERWLQFPPRPGRKRQQAWTSNLVPANRSGP